MTIYYSVTQNSVGQSDPLRLDNAQAEFKVGVTLEITGTATATVEYTMDKPEVTAADQFANATWYDAADLTDLTATTTALIDTPVTAIRADTTAYTSGDVRLKALQGDA